MTNLRKRPFQVMHAGDFTPDHIENIFRHYDDQMNQIDGRRISQITPLATNATLADVINKLNVLIAALNGSDLSND